MIEFKHDIDPRDLQKLQPAAWILFTAANLFLEERGYKCIITSLISDRKNVTAISKTHEQGRAFDLSTHFWSLQTVADFIRIMNRDYQDIAAISYSDGVKRAAVYHNGAGGNHMHCQVRPNAPYQKFVSYRQ